MLKLTKFPPLFGGGFVLLHTPGSYASLFQRTGLSPVRKLRACDQRSSMSVGSKRQALAFYFLIPNCYTFLISKRRKESNQGLCTTLVLAKRMPTLADSDTFCGHTLFLFASTQVVQRLRFDFSLHFDIRNKLQFGMEK